MYTVGGPGTIYRYNGDKWKKYYFDKQKVNK